MNSRDELQQLQHEFKAITRLRNGLFAPLQQLPAQINELHRLADTCQNEAQKIQLLQQCTELKAKLMNCKSTENLKKIEQFDLKLTELTEKIKALQIKVGGNANPNSPSFLL